MSNIVHRGVFPYFLFFLVFLAYSCKKKTEPVKATLPTGLNTVIQTTGGMVSVAVTATNANFYSTTYHDLNDSVYSESNDGLSSYMFSSSGVYKIVSRAHTSQNEFIEKIEHVTITLVGSTGGVPATGYTTPLAYPGYSLVWSDEFTDITLSTDWIFDIGTGNSGWGNNELQYYTNQNYTLENGVLAIIAKKQTFNAQQYTSTRIKTQGIKSWKFGRIDVRAALPYGKGIWPAIWMLGDNISNVGWPACGEIDIMELIGGLGAPDRTVHGTVHWDASGYASYGNSNSLPSGKFADEFHVFSIIWNQTSIKWLRDDIVYNEINITSAQMSEFSENFFMILNVAVGGNWPGSPDATSTYPQTMYVDYVRVFQ
jgi:beta-glucanase (GH16 family)